MPYFSSIEKEQGLTTSSDDIPRKCLEVDAAFKQLDQELRSLETAFEEAVSYPTIPSVEIARCRSNITTIFNNLIRGIKIVKLECRDICMSKCQTRKAFVRLTETFARYQNLERNSWNNLKDPTMRQYRTSHPNATSEEIEKAAEGYQIVLSSGRNCKGWFGLPFAKPQHDSIGQIKEKLAGLAQLLDCLDEVALEQGIPVGSGEQEAQDDRRELCCALIFTLTVIIFDVVIAIIVVGNSCKGKKD